MTYLSTVLADAPVHYWRLAELGGQIAHDIGSFPLQLEGAGGPNQTGYTGIAADGLSARSPNGGGFIHNAAVWPGLGCPFTLECWIWPLGGFSVLPADPFLLDCGNFGLYLTGTNRLQVQLYVQDGGTAKTASSPGQILNQAWHHIVGTYDLTTLRLYVDGVQVATNTATAAPAATALNVCQSPSGVRPADVFITEIANWNRALSAASVAAHYAAQEVTTSPVFLGAGNADIVNGTFTPTNDTLLAILNSVRRTYP